MFAAAAGFTDVVKLLVERGADVNARVEVTLLLSVKRICPFPRSVFFPALLTSSLKLYFEKNYADATRRRRAAYRQVTTGSQVLGHEPTEAWKAYNDHAHGQYSRLAFGVESYLLFVA